MSIRHLFAALCVATLATPAVAERAWLHELEPGSDGVRSVRVDLSDIDLATADGEGILRDRLRHAAFVVCDGPLPNDVFYGDEARTRAACRKDTARSLETKLADLHSRVRSGERVVVTLTMPGASAAS